MLENSFEPQTFFYGLFRAPPTIKALKKCAIKMVKLYVCTHLQWKQFDVLLQAVTCLSAAPLNAVFLLGLAGDGDAGGIYLSVWPAHEAAHASHQHPHIQPRRLQEKQELPWVKGQWLKPPHTQLRGAPSNLLFYMLSVLGSFVLYIFIFLQKSSARIIRYLAGFKEIPAMPATDCKNCSTLPGARCVALLRAEPVRTHQAAQ